MKKLTALIGMLLMSSAAQAGGLVSAMSSSVQLNVDAARTTATRIGNSYSITGSNVGTSDGTTAGMLSGGSITSGVYDPGTITANQLNATSGDAFSFSTSFIEGDAIETNAATVGEVPNYSSVTSYATDLPEI